MEIVCATQMKVNCVALVLASENSQIFSFQDRMLENVIIVSFSL